MKENLMALLLTGAIIVVLGFSLFLMYSAASNTDEAVRGAIRTQEMKRSIEDQNISYYNKIYNRVDRYTTNLTDYQYNTNKRLDHLEERIKRLEASNLAFPVTINNQNGNSEASIVTNDNEIN